LKNHNSYIPSIIDKKLQDLIYLYFDEDEKITKYNTEDLTIYNNMRSITKNKNRRKRKKVGDNNEMVVGDDTKKLIDGRSVSNTII
jgi:hypothetical protein